MHVLARWLLSALALLLVSQLITGFEIVDFYAALIVALFVGVLNAFVRPIILVLTLPINIVTLGLFTLVINAFIVWFVSTFVKGFEVDGFAPVFLATIMLWILNWISNQLIHKDDPHRHSGSHVRIHTVHKKSK